MHYGYYCSKLTNGRSAAGELRTSSTMMTNRHYAIQITKPFIGKTYYIYHWQDDRQIERNKQSIQKMCNELPFYQEPQVCQLHLLYPEIYTDILWINVTETNESTRLQKTCNLHKKRSICWHLCTHRCPLNARRPNRSWGALCPSRSR